MDPKQENKPHVLCIPVPLQGHINPMLKLAKILHSKGFDITFVNTEVTHDRLVQSQGSDARLNLPSFRFETIPDGLPPPENKDVSRDIISQAKSLDETCFEPFKRLLTKVNDSYSPVTCIVADVHMAFTHAAAQEFNIPRILFYVCGPSSLICCDQFPNLLKNGSMPLKDTSFLTNGYLDTVIDYIPTMSGIRLKDIPSLIRMLNPGEEYMVELFRSHLERAKESSAIIFNTFDELDHDVLDTLSSTYPPCYGIGPLHLLEKNTVDKSLASIKSSLWKEESECLKWLDSQAPLSVLYVNFGSIVVMKPEKLVEFCWGLAKSNCSFLWIIRQDVVSSESSESVLPPKFVAETSDRGMLVGWCPQEEVLGHPSIGGFLTHCGWNSTIESISSGVPMICWPFFGDQLSNCWTSCNKWGVAMEIDDYVKSDEVSKIVIEMMNGEKGNEMRKNAIEWKNKAEEACTAPLGSSIANLEKLIELMKTTSK